jgi:hypothetical protein
MVPVSYRIILFHGNVPKDKKCFRSLNWHPCQGHMKKRVKLLADDSYIV